MKALKNISIVAGYLATAVAIVCLFIAISGRGGSLLFAGCIGVVMGCVGIYMAVDIVENLRKIAENTDALKPALRLIVDSMRDPDTQTDSMGGDGQN